MENEKTRVVGSPFCFLNSCLRVGELRHRLWSTEVRIARLPERSLVGSGLRRCSASGKGGCGWTSRIGGRVVGHPHPCKVRTKQSAELVFHRTAQGRETRSCISLSSAGAENPRPGCSVGGSTIPHGGCHHLQPTIARRRVSSVIPMSSSLTTIVGETRVAHTFRTMYAPPAKTLEIECGFPFRALPQVITVTP